MRHTFLLQIESCHYISMRFTNFNESLNLSKSRLLRQVCKMLRVLPQMKKDTDKPESPLSFNINPALIEKYSKQFFWTKAPITQLAALSIAVLASRWLRAVWACQIDWMCNPQKRDLSFRHLPGHSRQVHEIQEAQRLEELVPNLL